MTGQQAYESYCTQAGADRWPAWESLSELTQAIWNQAAQGAMLALVGRVVGVRDNGALKVGEVLSTEPQLEVRVNG